MNECGVGIRVRQQKWTKMIIFKRNECNKYDAYQLNEKLKLNQLIFRKIYCGIFCRTSSGDGCTFGLTMAHWISTLMRLIFENLKLLSSHRTYEARF